jgi:hypothetical protein
VEKLYPNLEVLNFGVGGYGMDQAYLRFMVEGSAFSPDVVIIGFVSAGLRRLENVYRRFLSTRNYPLVKPRFLLDENGRLIEVRSPIEDISEYELLLVQPRAILKLAPMDQWYEPLVYENPLYDISASVRLLSTAWGRFYSRYLDKNAVFKDGVFNSSSTAFRLQIAILNQFVEQVRAAGAVPVVAIFPSERSLERAGASQARVFDPLLEYLKGQDVEYIDLTDAFLAVGSESKSDTWFMPGGHYSPAGNAIVASAVGKYLWEGEWGGEVAAGE